MDPSTIQSSVDTSRPFRSVKEAVAVFGERILLSSAYVSPARSDTSKLWEETTPKPKNDSIADALKKVRAELEETKSELRILKERERETEVDVAGLKAELHKSMSRLAAAEAANAAATRVGREEERNRELKKRMEKNTTLAQILSLGLGENDTNLSDRFGSTRKIKPVVPLVGDLFSSLKKGYRSTNSPLYSAPSQLFH